MEEKSISERESLLLIQQMIATAKKEQKDDGKGWILWGWMILLASLLTAANQQFRWFETFFFWNMFGVFTALFFCWDIGRRFFFRKTVRVKTYTGDLFRKLDTGFFISLMFVIVCINYGSRLVSIRVGRFDDTVINLGFALLINLYAFWILIYGTALSFRPSVIAAYLTWVLGFAALFSNDFQTVMLLQAGAALVGYIIPGYLANREFKKTRKEALDRV